MSVDTRQVEAILTLIDTLPQEARAEFDRRYRERFSLTPIQYQTLERAGFQDVISPQAPDAAALMANIAHAEQEGWFEIDLETMDFEHPVRVSSNVS